MNKKYAVIALSLALIAPNAGAKTTKCFNPYQVRVSNQSGGPAELKGSINVSGFRKGINNAIPNFKSQDVVVEEMGASMRVEHGPEGKEKVDKITFYEKTGPIPMVILKGTTIEVRGFNVHQGQQYNVVIKNQSGGIAKVLGTCDAAIRGDIDNGSSRDVKVRSGSTISLNMGPKGNKKSYKIRFSTAVEGGKPTITLNEPSKGLFDIAGWFRSAIVGQDVRFGAAKLNTMNRSIKLGPKNEGPKTRSGCLGKDKKAEMHG